jgi:hypothetical protein
MGITPLHYIILPAVVARHGSSVAMTTYPVGYHPVVTNCIDPFLKKFPNPG